MPIIELVRTQFQPIAAAAQPPIRPRTQVRAPADACA